MFFKKCERRHAILATYSARVGVGDAQERSAGEGSQALQVQPLTTAAGVIRIVALVRVTLLAHVVGVCQLYDVDRRLESLQDLQCTVDDGRVEVGNA